MGDAGRCGVYRVNLAVPKYCISELLLSCLNYEEVVPSSSILNT